MVISGKDRDINEAWALLVFYAAQNGSFVATIRDKPFSRVKQSKKNSFILVPKRRYRTAILSCAKSQTSTQPTIFFIFYK